MFALVEPTGRKVGQGVLGVPGSGKRVETSGDKKGRVRKGTKFEASWSQLLIKGNNYSDV